MADIISTDQRSARLLQFVSETLTASGRTDCDSREILGKLISQHGHGGLFDARNNLDARRATRALAEALPPLKSDDIPSVENGYGYTVEGFAKLHPLDRLKIQNRFEFDAANAAAEVKRCAERDALSAALPPTWDSFTDGMKTWWLNRYNEEKRAADETAAKAARLEQETIAERKRAYAAEFKK